MQIFNSNINTVHICKIKEGIECLCHRLLINNRNDSPTSHKTHNTQYLPNSVGALIHSFA